MTSFVLDLMPVDSGSRQTKRLTAGLPPTQTDWFVLDFKVGHFTAGSAPSRHAHDPAEDLNN